jgi:SAM-dependent methyltransferase
MTPEYAARYGSLEQWHWWFRARQRIFADVLRRELPGGAARTLLAVGCGPAEGLRWLLPFARDGRIIGLDADPVHATDLPTGVSFAIGRCEAAPLTTNAVDAVLALDVIEHVEDDAAALSEAVRVLRPGGLLLVSVPALPSLWGPQDEVSLHVRRYTRATLAATFARAGLPSPRITYFNTLLFPLIAGVRWTRRALGRNQTARTDFDDNRPGLVNELLLAVFQLERHLLQHVRLPIGVSLLATLHATGTEPEGARPFTAKREGEETS